MEDPSEEPLLGQQQGQRAIGLLRAWRILTAYKRAISIALGPLAALLILLCVKIHGDRGGPASRMLAILAWICIWWVSEAIPIAITSLAPLCLLPAMELASADDVAMSYMNDTITIFIGSFVLALAVERYQVHRRLALRMLLFFGGSKMDPRLVLLGFCAGPAFVSMWISNTAAAIMMVPMSIGVLHKLESGHISYIQSHSLCPTCGAEDVQRLESVPSIPSGNLPPLSPAGGAEDDDRKNNNSSRLSKQNSFFSRDFNIHLLMNKEEVAAEVAHIANFGRAVVMAIMFSVTIGGLATLTGSSTNMILSGMWSREFPSAAPVTYLQWFLFGFPLALCLLIFCWGMLCLRYCRAAAVPAISHSLNRASIEEEYTSLGPTSFAEASVLSLFVILAALWLTRSLGTVGGWGQLFDGYVGDGSVSILVATLLFVIPNKLAPGEMLMDWPSCKKLPWDIVLLLGGGFALAEGIETSGLSAWMTQNMGFLNSAPYLLVAPAAGLLVSITTEFTSNNATATIFLPLLADIALSIGIHPLYMMLTGTITASFAFMLPIATPPNAIAFSTGYLRIVDTLTMGLVLKLFGLVAISILMPTLGALVFGLNQPLSK
ncbi:tonoplast dicarboxylate transporter-like [Selaginella moellendorffii]|uniref:tonoplast dicarboxylate transporter-like n=1 Tax=Selaginella moellendorffii TaxID=88036 RepID=UPI000D1CD8FF|nr:tonoplast dicarboxylate transporter-like [Selaginella moellendorffii]|eukprot:XP_024534532.1 tonoplast dicarboxylate transporter-like [Selaginella moellendorffii]